MTVELEKRIMTNIDSKFTIIVNTEEYINEFCFRANHDCHALGNFKNLFYFLFYLVIIFAFGLYKIFLKKFITKYRFLITIKIELIFKINYFKKIPLKAKRSIGQDIQNVKQYKRIFVRY